MLDPTAGIQRAQGVEKLFEWMRSLGSRVSKAARAMLRCPDGLGARLMAQESECQVEAEPRAAVAIVGRCAYSRGADHLNS
jgi:hypothetical protein